MLPLSNPEQTYQYAGGLGRSIPSRPAPVNTHLLTAAVVSDWTAGSAPASHWAANVSSAPRSQSTAAAVVTTSAAQLSSHPRPSYLHDTSIPDDEGGDALYEQAVRESGGGVHAGVHYGQRGRGVDEEVGRPSDNDLSIASEAAAAMERSMETTEVSCERSTPTPSVYALNSRTLNPGPLILEP